MKTFKNFLRKIDLFGAPFNFKYKTKEKYSTPFGGLFLILFCSFGLAFGIYYLLPFINRKNLSIIYYTMNIPKTESISLKDSEAAFSIGLDCENKTGVIATDVFKLESNYILYIKNKKGSYDKNITRLESHYCKYEDFYNKYNNSFEYLSLNKYQCLDDYDHNIEGIFSDQIFSYYEFSVIAKNKTEDVDEYLRLNDCKFQFYYTDITIDLFNYKEPIKPFLNVLFIQLNPTLFIKRNIYFMNQYLFDDDMIIQVFDEEQKPKKMETLFSRYEEYSLYLGLEREKTKPLNEKNYAKIYIRADTKKTEIRRTYQKLTEFFADASSLLVAIYDVITIIFSFINNFYGEQAIIKKLFIFKGIDSKYFYFSRKYEQIRRLATLSREKDFKSNDVKKEFNDIHFNTNFENAKNENKDISGKVLISSGSHENKRIKEIMKNKNKNEYKTFLTRENENYDNSKRQIKNIRNTLKLKDNIINDDINHRNTLEKEENKIKDKNGMIKQNIKGFSFNIFEIFEIMVFPCCLRGQLKIKNYLNDKAINILYSKLNIILYVRNMILFDIINRTILDGSKKHIINFLSRPVLSMNKNTFEEKDIFYEGYKEEDFDKFYDGFLELVKKPNKKNKEKQLALLSKGHLKELI